MRALLSFVLLSIILSVTISKVSGQTCAGSLGNPVVDETFGVTNGLTAIGPPLASGETTLQYTNDPCDEDGDSYGLTTFIRGCHAGTWHTIYQDHTGDPNGLFMVINGPATPEVVYTKTVPGSTLCPNTTYEFAAYVMNILKLSDATKDWVLPNLTFSIETSAGKVLKTITIGDMPETTEPVWNKYGTFFTSPSDGSDVVVKLIDNQTLEGNGNDFAVDDITFSPCGPLIQTGFTTLGNIDAQYTCPNASVTYTMVASQQGYESPAYQWQQNLNDGKGWVDVPGANTTTLVKTLNNPAPGTYTYRIGVLSAANSSLSCRIYSQPLSIMVNAVIPPLNPVTNICAGDFLGLEASEGDSFQWTGPNNFSSTARDPVIDKAAQPSDDGLYTLTISFRGCQSSSSTMVTVYPKINAVVSGDVTICQGTATTLTAAQSQGATTFSWSPSTGLSDVNQPTVTANPTQTTTYTVSLSNGCATQTRNVTVTVLDNPVANAGPAKTMMAGDAVKLNGSVTGEDINYYWTPTTYLDNPNSLTPTASPPDNITYTLHAESTFGCGDDISTVFVRVYQPLTVPNTFTPNNDGINDTWDIKNLITYPECTVTVFDRYGQQVYQSYGYPKPWNGTYGGKALPTGTYYYIIDLNNGMSKLAGWVLIVR